MDCRIISPHYNNQHCVFIGRSQKDRLGKKMIMFKKFSNIEKNFSVSKAAFIIGFFTLLSKVVALFRDPLILGKIGVNDTTDIYFSAFRIPDFIFQLLVL